MEYTKMKAAFFEIEPWEQEYIRQQLSGLEVSFFTDKLSEENLDQMRDFQVVSCFIDSPLTSEVLSRFTNLKLIATRSTGFDHIDLAYCREKGIVVCNVPTYGENTVAEHTFALILDLSRKITPSIERTKKGDFSLDGLRGFDLKGKTLGIVGMGNIGQHVARIAGGFEMKVIAFDTRPDKKLAKLLGFSYAEFGDLLKNSDIITLHVPYNDHTHHLINSQNIGNIKRGAYLINTSRGGIVETSALVDALGKGILAGAGLDVLEEECFIKEESQLLSKEFPKTCNVKTLLQNHVLLKQDNVIITPHNAFNSKEALERILNTTIENIQSFLKEKSTNTVTV
jgi:D-lactate dehydrogenase